MLSCPCFPFLHAKLQIIPMILGSIITALSSKRLTDGQNKNDIQPTQTTQRYTKELIDVLTERSGFPCHAIVHKEKHFLTQAKMHLLLRFQNLSHFLVSGKKVDLDLLKNQDKLCPEKGRKEKKKSALRCQDVRTVCH